MRSLAILAGPLAILAAAAPVHADVTDGGAIPDGITTDRLHAESSFAADFNITLWDEIFGTELLGIGLVLRGQYMTGAGDAGMRAGGYVTLPLGWGEIDPPLLDAESDFGIGNVELGGALALDAGGGVVIGRLGVALPTAEDDDNGAGPILNFPAHLTDVVLYPDDTTSLRLSGSYLRRMGNAFIRGDVGLDVPFGDDDMSAFNDEDPIVRLNAAGGFVAGDAALMVELVTVATTGDVGDDEDRFFHTLAFGARYLGESVQPMAALVIPLDDGINDFVDLSIIAGITAPLPE